MKKFAIVQLLLSLLILAACAPETPLPADAEGWPGAMAKSSTPAATNTLAPTWPPTFTSTRIPPTPDTYPEVLPLDQEAASNAGGGYLNPESANNSLALLAEMTGISVSDMRVVEAQSGSGESFSHTAVAVAEMSDGREVFVLWVGPDGTVGENPDWAPVAVEGGALPVLVELPQGLDYAVYVEDTGSGGRYIPYIMDASTGDPVALIAGFEVDVDSGESQPLMLLVNPETGQVYPDVLVTENFDGQLVMSDEAGYHIYNTSQNIWEGLEVQPADLLSITEQLGITVSQNGDWIQEVNFDGIDLEFDFGDFIQTDEGLMFEYMAPEEFGGSPVEHQVPAEWVQIEDLEHGVFKIVNPETGTVEDEIRRTDTFGELVWHPSTESLKANFVMPPGALPSWAENTSYGEPQTQLENGQWVEMYTAVLRGYVVDYEIVKESIVGGGTHEIISLVLAHEDTKGYLIFENLKLTESGIQDWGQNSSHINSVSTISQLRNRLTKWINNRAQIAFSVFVNYNNQVSQRIDSCNANLMDHCRAKQSMLFDRDAHEWYSQYISGGVNEGEWIVDFIYKQLKFPGSVDGIFPEQN